MRDFLLHPCQDILPYGSFVLGMEVYQHGCCFEEVAISLVSPFSWKDIWMVRWSSEAVNIIYACRGIFALLVKRICSVLLLTVESALELLFSSIIKHLFCARLTWNFWTEKCPLPCVEEDGKWGTAPKEHRSQFVQQDQKGIGSLRLVLVC